MNGLGAADLGREKNRGLVQVAVDRSGRADAQGLVGPAYVDRVAVGLGMHGDGPQPEATACALDAKGNLSAVGDQDAVEHRFPHAKRSSTCPASTSWPDVTSTACTVASCGARTSLNTFIASMTHSVCPPLTACPTTTNGGSPGDGSRCTTP